MQQIADDQLMMACANLAARGTQNTKYSVLLFASSSLSLASAHSNTVVRQVSFVELKIVDDDRDGRLKDQLRIAIVCKKQRKTPLHGSYMQYYTYHQYNRRREVKVSCAPL